MPNSCVLQTQQRSDDDLTGSSSEPLTARLAGFDTANHGWRILQLDYFTGFLMYAVLALRSNAAACRDRIASASWLFDSFFDPGWVAPLFDENPTGRTFRGCVEPKYHWRERQEAKGLLKGLKSNALHERRINGCVILAFIKVF